MKLNPLFFIPLCLLASHATAALTPEQKADAIRTHYKHDPDICSRYPANPKIEVFFFDLNGDGVEELLVATNGRRDGFGGICQGGCFVVKEILNPRNDTRVRTLPRKRDTCLFCFFHRHKFSLCARHRTAFMPY